MGNYCLLQFSAEKNCLGKVDRIKTFNVENLSSVKGEENENNLQNKKSNNLDPQIWDYKDSTQNNLLQVSSLGRIQRINSTNETKENSKFNKNFSTSMFNKDFPEDVNMNENNFSYNYFFSKIFEEINNARKDLLLLSKLVKKYANEIKSDENKKNYLLSNDKKIYFDFDKNDFLQVVKKLENLNNKMKQEKSVLQEFKYVEEICFPIPKKSFEEIFENNYVKKQMEILKNKFTGKYDISKLVFFKCTKDPEISLVVKIVDEMKKNKAKFLLNEELKFININFIGLNDGMIGVFLVL